MITLKEFFSFRSNRFFWINLLGMIVVVMAAAWGTLIWLDQYTHHGESYVVPSVKNKSLEQAEILLNTQKMKMTVVDSTYVKGLPAGIVLEQAPQAGMRVKEGRTVYLTINTNEVPLVKIPDVIDNSSLRQAAAKLKAMGFRLTEPERVPGEPDWIYGIKFRGKSLVTGDKVPHESLLTLCVGDSHLRDSLQADSFYMESIENVSEEIPEVDDSWF